MTRSGIRRIALALWAPERAGYVDVDGAPLELPRDARERRCHSHHTRQRAGCRADPRSNARYRLRCRRGAGRDLADAAREHPPGRGAARVALADRRRRPSASDGVWSAISTTARSSGWWRSRSELGLARELADTEDAAKQLDAIEDDAVVAMEELRALAHGIYPGVLHEHGPAAALRSLARTAPRSRLR